MSTTENRPYPDPATLADQYLEDSKRYDELRVEAYRVHFQAGKQLFTRFRFYLLGLIVAGVAFAIINRDLSAPLLQGWPEITSVRVALAIWAIGVAFGLYSIQATITAHFIDARVDSLVFAHMSQFSGLAARQNQRLAGGKTADPEIEKRIEKLQAERDKASAELEEKQLKIIAREHRLSAICAACFFFGSTTFAIPLFN